MRRRTSSTIKGKVTKRVLFAKISCIRKTKIVSQRLFIAQGLRISNSEKVNGVVIGSVKKKKECSMRLSSPVGREGEAAEGLSLGCKSDTLVQSLLRRTPGLRSWRARRGRWRPGDGVAAGGSARERPIQDRTHQTRLARRREEWADRTG